MGGIPLDEIGATGYGLAAAVEEAAAAIGMRLKGARVAVQGLGAVGQHAARFLAEAGCRLVACSDTDGTLIDPDGPDVARLVRHKQSGSSVVKALMGQAAPAEAILDAACDIWIPAARPDVLSRENAHRVTTKISMPWPPMVQQSHCKWPAKRLLHRNGLRVAPARVMALAVFVLPLLAAVDPALEQLSRQHYLDLFAARHAPVTEAQVQPFRLEMEKQKKSEQDRLRNEEKALQKQVEQGRKRLQDLNRETGPETDERLTRRRQLHCELVKLERELASKRTEREKGVPHAFENRIAKVEIAWRWPAQKSEIEKRIATGQGGARKFGDVRDIGVRKIADNQDHDIKLGRDVIQEMKVYGLMPPEVRDERLTGYMNRLASELAASSDLRVPVKVTILQSEEINAFMLPGGFLFINTGLIERAESESELAGVLAHEIAHAAARHGRRMMVRATIANIVFQAAQVAALVLTGGVAGIGTYYGLQYGFYGLGMVLELSLLGVNREFEAEADQLGAQYAWKAGYDPAGFVTFFDKMAREEGYARSASFFRTHPPFADRILATFSEMLYLPKKENLRMDSSEFQEICQYCKVKGKTTDPGRKRPSLRPFPECDPPAEGAPKGEGACGP